MKYIYFDCYAGFDLQMALGALIDMSENCRLAEMTAQKIVPSAGLFTESVKRQSMDALLAYFDISGQKDGNIEEFAERICTDDAMNSKIKRWLSLRDDGKKHDFAGELCELVYFVACAELIKESGAEKVYISAVGQGSGVIQKGNNIDFIPSKHTELLTKMTGIPIIDINVEDEILTPSALAFLYVFGAEYMPPKAHDVIKSGYGAGAKLLSVPNIARCILAKDEEDEVSLGFDCIFSEFSSEFATVSEMKK